MHELTLALASGWRVLLAGLVLGAGLPALFAVGVRSMAWGAGGEAEVHAAGTAAAPAAHPVGRLVATVCFLVVVLAVALGITFVVATGMGKTLSFEHTYPTITTKH
jgi:hypothetical protein